jgi:hypothetical protein
LGQVCHKLKSKPDFIETAQKNSTEIKKNELLRLKTSKNQMLNGGKSLDKTSKKLIITHNYRSQPGSVNTPF